MQRLTIAIPTFNRHEILKKNLPLLLRQLTPACSLIIIDNHSNPPIELTDFPEIPENLSTIKLIRNKCNIGGNSNVLRCFEVCEDEYLWVLGDDDPVKPDAIQTIFHHIQRFPQAIFFHYFCDCPGHRKRTDYIHPTSPEELLQAFHSIGEGLFVSTYVFKTNHFHPNLNMANFFAFTCAPQLVLGISSFSTGNHSVLCPQQIVSNGGPLNDPKSQGSTLLISRSLPLILDAPFSKTVRIELIRLLENSTDDWLTPGRVFHQTILLMLSSPLGDDEKRFFQLSCQRLFCYIRKFWPRFQLFFMKILIHFPKFSYQLLQLFYFLFKGERTGKHLLRDSKNF
ncbi:MAG: hypothetical protein ACD_56C00156G0006 [uncultured bacterium]|nr:MAG: hypothetical protein ACD_56C00156G0006 [uncultured bacterium]